MTEVDLKNLGGSLAVCTESLTLVQSLHVGGDSIFRGDNSHWSGLQTLGNFHLGNLISILLLEPISELLKFFGFVFEVFLLLLAGIKFKSLFTDRLQLVV